MAVKGRPKKGEEAPKESHGLTEEQKNFCVYYVHLCDFNAKKAVEMAYNKGGEHAQSNICHKERSLMANQKVLKYIKHLSDQRVNQTLVDQFWVIKKLRQLAEDGAENIQLKATELLGKTMSMFSDRQEVIDVGEDPAKLAKEALRRRKEQQNTDSDNLVPFTGTDGDTDDEGY
jgi:hypothetical protein